MVSLLQFGNNNTNNMNSSLKRSLEEDSGASLINVVSGEKHEIKIVDEPFIIGRIRKSSLLIEESYISRVHCLINYYTETNKFVINDNYSVSGTFVNNEILPKGTKIVLHHGDLIGFGSRTHLDFVYKFVLNNYKKIKISELHLKNDLAKHKAILESFTSDLNKMNSERTKFEETVDLKLAECNKKLDQLTKCAENLMKIKNEHNELKSEIINHLEDNFQCSICNELVLKASIGECTHSFCESCISTWLKKSSFCPVCRATMSSTSNCLAIDNFIKDISELFGGNIKAQRETLERERNIVPTNRETRAQRLQRRSVRAIEVVDLTHF